METKILTPIQLWQDFKTNITDFKTNIIRFEKTADNVNVCELYFTAGEQADGDIRVYCKALIPQATASAATILLINEFEQSYDEILATYFLEAGYAVVTFDYCGKGYGENYTRYPQSLSYGNFKQSGDHLNTCYHGADKTCLFLWCKITRQVISFIKSFSQVLKSDKVFACGANSGANILWQVAGVDDRLNGIIPINNTGFDCFNGNVTSFDNLSAKEFSERTLWSICSAVPSYAKFITCPILFVGASNNVDYDYSTLSDTLKLIPEGISHSECMSIGCSRNLYQQTKTSILNWIDDVVKEKPVCSPPKLSAFEKDNKLFIGADFDTIYEDITTAEICVAYGDNPDCVKNWKVYNVGVNLMGKASVRIKAYDLKEPIFITAAVTYRNGTMQTAPLTTITAEEVSKDIKLTAKNKRIIYDKNLGVNSFFPRANSYFVDKACIGLQKGALDIAGITTSSGDLVCYNIEDPSSTAEDILLQFDCFSTSKRTFTIEIQDITLASYFAEVTLEGSNEWQNVKISYSAFLNDGVYPLKHWKGVRMIAFCKAENILFNNVIWL